MGRSHVATPLEGEPALRPTPTTPAGQPRMCGLRRIYGAAEATPIYLVRAVEMCAIHRLFHPHIPSGAPCLNAMILQSNLCFAVMRGVRRGSTTWTVPCGTYYWMDKDHRWKRHGRAATEQQEDGQSDDWLHIVPH